MSYRRYIYMLYVALSFFEHRDLTGVCVEAGDGEPCLAEFDDKGQTDVAEADDPYAGGTGFDAMQQGHLAFLVFLVHLISAVVSFRV